MRRRLGAVIVLSWFLMGCNSLAPMRDTTVTMVTPVDRPALGSRHPVLVSVPSSPDRPPRVSVNDKEVALLSFYWYDATERIAKAERPADDDNVEDLEPVTVGKDRAITVSFDSPGPPLRIRIRFFASIDATNRLPAEEFSGVSCSIGEPTCDWTAGADGISTRVQVSEHTAVVIISALFEKADVAESQKLCPSSNYLSFGVRIVP